MEDPALRGTVLENGDADEDVDVLYAPQDDPAILVHPLLSPLLSFLSTLPLD